MARRMNPYRILTDCNVLGFVTCKLVLYVKKMNVLNGGSDLSLSHTSTYHQHVIVEVAAGRRLGVAQA